MAADAPTCANCNYFKPLPVKDSRGLCLIHAPRRTDAKIEQNTDDGRWPLCFALEWCGEWAKKA